jgi:hypothetical protein
MIAKFSLHARHLSQLQRLQLGAVASNAAMGALGTVGRWQQVLRLAMIRPGASCGS